MREKKLWNLSVNCGKGEKKSKFNHSVAGKYCEIYQSAVWKKMKNSSSGCTKNAVSGTNHGDKSGNSCCLLCKRSWNPSIDHRKISWIHRLVTCIIPWNLPMVWENIRKHYW